MIFSRPSIEVERESDDATIKMPLFFRAILSPWYLIDEYIIDFIKNKCMPSYMACQKCSLSWIFMAQLLLRKIEDVNVLNRNRKSKNKPCMTR